MSKSGLHMALTPASLGGVLLDLASIRLQPSTHHIPLFNSLAASTALFWTLRTIIHFSRSSRTLHACFSLVYQHQAEFRTTTLISSHGIRQQQLHHARTYCTSATCTHCPCPFVKAKSESFFGGIQEETCSLRRLFKRRWQWVGPRHFCANHV